MPTRQQLRGRPIVLLVIGMAFVELSGMGTTAAEPPKETATLPQAAPVDVFYAGGQSNAGREWHQGIEETLKGAAPGQEVVVLHAGHSGAHLKSRMTDEPQDLFGAAFDTRGFERTDLWHLTPAHAKVVGEGMAKLWIERFTGKGDAAPKSAAAEKETAVAPKTRALDLTGRLLLVPVAKGQQPVAKGQDRGRLSVRVDGRLVHDLETHLAQTQEEVAWWAALDMSKYVGKQAVLAMSDLPDQPGLSLIESSDLGSNHWLFQRPSPQQQSLAIEDIGIKKRFTWFVALLLSHTPSSPGVRGGGAGPCGGTAIWPIRTPTSAGRHHTGFKIAGEITGFVFLHQMDEVGGIEHVLGFCVILELFAGRRTEQEVDPWFFG